ncbi:hypothetical protein AB0L05_08070 [Nonomuraea pusilla]|uniref:hypothetical protein n=1 Tax=Nonomuraea pusilla TaxID=46177 RepID=UPI00331AB969
MVTQVVKGSGYATAFKVAVALGTLSVLAQGVTAGQVLGGGAAATHAVGATAVHVLGLAQLVAAVLLWRPGREGGWPALVSLVVLLLGMVQSALGGTGVLTVHVPLAMVLCALNVWLLVWAWRR